MKFKRLEDMFIDDDLKEDSRDQLDCFGEFNCTDRLCTCYCADCISCAIEHSQNPSIDLYEHILAMDFFPARIN